MRQKIKFLALTLCCTALLGVGECVKRNWQDSGDLHLTHPAAIATASIAGLGNSGVQGYVTFLRVEDGLRIAAEVSGIERTGWHGFHIHETGNCSAPDGSSAGGHFNPTHKPHGEPNSTHNHLGDLGNIYVNERGQGRLNLWLQDKNYDLDAAGGWQAIVGRALIIHAGTDDYKTQPSGNAGDRIACGVIESTHKAALSE